MLALARLAQQEDGAALHHVDAVIDEAADRLVEPQFARLAVEHREKDHGEALLHLRVLVELVEHNLRLRAALELDHDAHAVAVALVAHVADVVDNLLGHQLGDALNELGLVHLVRNLGDDDRLLFLGHVLNRHSGAHHKAAAAGFVGLRNAALAVEKSAGGKVRPLHVLQHFGQPALGFFTSAMVAFTTSVRLCGGILVAMPTAMPLDPLTIRLGMRVGSTVGSKVDSS